MENLWLFGLLLTLALIYGSKNNLKKSMEKKIFKESSSAGLKKVALIFLVILLLLTGLIALDGFKSPGFLLIMLGVFAFTMLISYLAIRAKGYRQVVCTAEGCEIGTADFWGRYSPEVGFRWRDVTDTNIVETFHDVSDGGVISNYIFQVAADNNRLIALWSLKMSSESVTSELFDYVSRATPQLKYVWEKTADFGSRQAIVDVDRYSKVARI